MPKSPVSLWHQAVEAKDKKALFSLLDKKCVFYSPILYKKQEGKALTKMYLSAAYDMFQEAENFRYVMTVEQNHQAVLEFNTIIDGIEVDGVDIITWNEEGKITEFKVMLRPYSAIEKVGQKMREKLDNMSAMDKLKAGIAVGISKLGG